MRQHDQGPRAAWGYLKLAMRALLGGYRLPDMSGASRTYLLTMFGLYGYFAFTFFVHIPGFGGGHIGVPLVDEPVLHACWGLAMASVSLFCVTVNGHSSH